MSIHINIAERVERAVAYFNEGYNCAQSVFLAYADVYLIDEEFAKKLSAPFGGGVGRMREMCGATTAMFMLMGLKYPVNNPNDREAKTINYDAVQRLAKEFKDSFGTINCGELLRLPVPEKDNPTPSERTAEYYAKRPCARFVAKAAEIVGKELMK